MRPTPAIPADSALPLPHARHFHRRRQVAGVDLRGIDVAHFNDVLHELNPDAPHVDSDAIASVSRWLVALSAAQADAMLQARLGRLEQLPQLLADADWHVESAIRQRIERLLAYVVGDGDLIPDDTPFVGKLDDAMLVELAWPALAEELEDYRDFCGFREESGQLYADHPSPEDWLQTRLEEGALREQLHRAHERRYTEYGPLGEVFHVS